MKIILYTAHPSGSGQLESKLPTGEKEIGSFMTRLFKLVTQVQEGIGETQELHWSVWFLKEQGSVTHANIEVEAVKKAYLPYSVTTVAGSELTTVLVASASSGMGAEESDAEIRQRTKAIIKKLKDQVK